MMCLRVSEALRLKRLLPNARVTKLEGSGHIPLLEARVDLAAIIKRSGITTRAAKAAPKPKDWVGDYKPPSAEAYDNATKSLLSARRLSSPVFLSTDASGRRQSGLGALPPLFEAGNPLLFVGNHQLYGFQDLPPYMGNTDTHIPGGGT